MVFTKYCIFRKSGLTRFNCTWGRNNINMLYWTRLKSSTLPAGPVFKTPVDLLVVHIIWEFLVSSSDACVVIGDHDQCSTTSKRNLASFFFFSQTEMWHLGMKEDGSAKYDN